MNHILLALVHRRVGRSQSRARDSAVAYHSTQVDADVCSYSIHTGCAIPAAIRPLRATPAAVIEGNVNVSLGALPLR